MEARLPERKYFLHCNRFMQHPVNYNASRVFTVVFTACLLCAHCAFTAVVTCVARPLVLAQVQDPKRACPKIGFGRSS